MKKILAVIFAALLALTAVSALAETPMMGGWTPAEDYAVTEELGTLTVNKAEVIVTTGSAKQQYHDGVVLTYDVADIFDTYVYRSGIQQGKYSFSTAVGLFQSVIGFILVVVFNRLSKRVSEDGGLW